MKDALIRLKISKTDSAKRQLETAISMWFFDGDPVSIHTLAAAAHQVVHDLGKHRGISATLREFPNIRPEYKKEMAQAVARIENFFKHADHDPHALLDFNPTTSAFILLDAVLTYEAVTGERPPILNAFRMWMILQNPQLVNEDFRSELAAQAACPGTGLERMSKLEFFTFYPTAILKTQNNTTAAISQSHPNTGKDNLH